MARCRITQPKKLQRLADRSGKTVVGAMVRGNNDHGILFWDGDGVKWWMDKDGTVSAVEGSARQVVESNERRYHPGGARWV